jgi:hypothetical protein
VRQRQTSLERARKTELPDLISGILTVNSGMAGQALLYGMVEVITYSKATGYHHNSHDESRCSIFSKSTPAGRNQEGK